MPRFLLIYFLFLLPTGAFAQQEAPYQLNTRNDLLVLGSGLALSAGGVYLQSQTEPLTEEKIAVLLPGNVLRFDRSATERLLANHATASNYLLGAAVVSPFALVADKQARSDAFVIAVMYLEVGLLNNGLTTLAKGSFNRIRPYVYNLKVPLDEKTSRDARHSFFSGHVSNTAAFSIFTAQLVNTYSDSQTLKTGVWTAALALPALTGVFRYTSGKHYPTDIIAGYLVGGAIGYLVPHFHERGRTHKLSQLQVYPLGNGLAAVYRL